MKTKYVDGFVLAVKKNKINAYKKMAVEGKKIWMKYGALGYKECMISDAKPKWVKLTFPKMVKVKKGETVWFSYIEYASKKHRDEVNKKVMAQMDKDKDKYKDFEMPFDMKRMAYGGFSVEVGD